MLICGNAEGIHGQRKVWEPLFQGVYGLVVCMFMNGVFQALRSNIITHKNSLMLFSKLRYFPKFLFSRVGLLGFIRKI